MKNGIVFLLSALIGLFFPFAHAENNAAAGATAQAATPPQRGMLYRIRHHNNTAYLFGTIHVGLPSFFPLEPQVTRALTSSSKLVLELDVRDDAPFQAALLKHGVYAGGDTIERHLSADSVAQLRSTLQKFGLPFENIRHMKPWIVANLLIGLDLERNGYRRSDGIEMFLLSLIDKQAKTVQELESAEYQMSLFDDMTDAMQEQYLRENLAELSDGQALKRAQALIDAWANANGKALDDIVRDLPNEKTASSEFMRQVLLGKRNPEMANKIEALLKNDKTIFVGIGLLHLVGEQGLPNLLRARGYEVEKLY
jgi:hypothetical protein